MKVESTRPDVASMIRQVSIMYIATYIINITGDGKRVRAWSEASVICLLMLVLCLCMSSHSAIVYCIAMSTCSVSSTHLDQQTYDSLLTRVQ